MPSRPGLLRRFFGALWSLIDFTRRFVVNALFLALVVIAAVAWFAIGRAPALKPDTALVLDLRGPLVEQYRSSGGFDALLSGPLASVRRETRLRDVMRALDAAADDPKIARVVLVLDELSGGGTPSLREVAAALTRFKDSGKQAIAWGSGFTQRQYFLATAADEIYLHPLGSVELRGFGGSGLYFRDALDKLGVTVHGFQSGRYKSIVEPFTRQAPSADALAADADWLNDAWSTWTAEVEGARGLEAGHIGGLIEALPARLVAAGGDMAQLALQEKLVDGLRTRDEFRALMIERGAPLDDKRGTFRQVSMSAYLSQVPEPAGGDAVGVVVAQGEIVSGDAPPGMVGGLATAELIRRAREDDAIKAIVLRIDSGGGSPFGSELIRREVELTRKAGKPVVASMGDAAASGGYWIAAAADEIVADPGTITGSIGVASLIPTFDRSLDKLGVGTGGASTTWLAAVGTPLQPLDKRVAQMADARIGSTYGKFLQAVAEGRSTTPEKIDAVAQGRVWTGRQAAQRGLVDTLGGLQDALASAARRAQLDDDYRVAYLERERRPIDRWIELLLSRVVAATNLGSMWDAGLPGVAAGVLPQFELGVRLLEQSRLDPLTVHAHCFCNAP